LGAISKGAEAVQRWRYSRQHHSSEVQLDVSASGLSLFTQIAEFSRRNRTLPPYYAIKNSILIAGALDNWDETDLWMLSAEQTYEYCYEISMKNQDEPSLSLLKGVRKQMDELEQYRKEDLLEEDMENMVIYEDEYNEEYVNEGIEGFKGDYSDESEGEAGHVDGDGEEDGLVGGDKDADVVGDEEKNVQRQ
jgi:hypothetical protein